MCKDTGVARWKIAKMSSRMEEVFSSCALTYLEVEATTAHNPLDALDALDALDLAVRRAVIRSRFGSEGWKDEGREQEMFFVEGRNPRSASGVSVISRSTGERNFFFCGAATLRVR
jgi:hypothetical protein